MLFVLLHQSLSANIFLEGNAHANQTENKAEGGTDNSKTSSAEGDTYMLRGKPTGEQVACR
jgi:hypothetical protein